MFEQLILEGLNNPHSPFDVGTNFSMMFEETDVRCLPNYLKLKLYAYVKLHEATMIVWKEIISR